MRVVLVVLVMAGIGCTCGPTSGADGGGGGAAGGGAAGGAVTDAGSDAGTADAGTPGSFLPRRTAAVYARRLRCGFSAATWSPPPESAYNLKVFEGVDRAVADGRLGYDAARAEQCLTQMATWPCTERGEAPPSCDGVLTGRIAEDGGCYLSFECATGARCLGNTCPLRCQGVASEGEVESTARPCGRGLSADDQGVCRRERREGEDCHPLDGGVLFRRCSVETYCKGTFMAGTCSKPLSAGSGCTSFDVCELGTSCTLGTCRRWSALNQPCSPTISDMARRCQVGLRCAAPTPTGMGTCQPPGQRGATCLAADECASGLVCIGAAVGVFGSCDSPLMEGSACTFGNECAAAHYCDVTCQAYRQLGQSCGAEPCASTLVCSRGACTLDCFDPTP